MKIDVPVIDLDLFDPSSLLDPYETYRRIRDVGPVVRLAPYEDFVVIARFKDVQQALNSAQLFSSAHGVALNDGVNRLNAVSVINSDDPVHALRRSVLMRPLKPGRLSQLRDRATAEAELLVNKVTGFESFDVAGEFARHLPFSIVYNLLGLPDVPPEELLKWTKAATNTLAPPSNPLCQSSLAVVEAMSAYIMRCTPQSVDPEGWAAELFNAAQEAGMSFEETVPLIFDYVGPSLDTTITAVSNTIDLLGRNPEAWDQLRENPSLVPNVINESVRLESPLQALSRMTTDDVKIDEIVIPKGTRVLLIYGSANRDERYWQDPNVFQADRKNVDHLGFGHGVHSCMGANLARLELSAILNAMIKRVRRIELHSQERLLNNFLRGFNKMEATFHPD